MQVLGCKKIKPKYQQIIARLCLRGTHRFERGLNRHGRIQDIMATHGYENTDWFFNMVLCVFMVKVMVFGNRLPLGQHRFY